MMRDRVSGHGATTRMPGSPKVARSEEEKAKAKEKEKVNSKSEEDCAWWSKGRTGKKGFSQGNEGFQKGGFRTYQPEMGAGNDLNPSNGRSKDEKRKG